jgi:hypothetical protein
MKIPSGSDAEGGYTRGRTRRGNRLIDGLDEFAALPLLPRNHTARTGTRAAECRIVWANHPGESAGRMRTTHPALAEGGVMADAIVAPSGSPPPPGSARGDDHGVIGWVVATSDHPGPAALTGQVADSKRGC